MIFYSLILVCVDCEMSSVKDNAAAAVVAEESEPLIEKQTAGVIVDSRQRQKPATAGGEKKSNLAKHRSVDTTLMEPNGVNGQADKPAKQILFRTGSHQTQPLSVHYDDDKGSKGTPEKVCNF